MKTVALVCFALFIVAALAQCPNSCSGNGSCNRATGVCSCNTNYAGADCSIYDRVLPSLSPLSGHVNFRTWHYFHFNGVANIGARLNLSVGTLQDADLYVKKGSYPTALSFDFVDASIGSTSVLTIPPNATAFTYYVGIFGFTPADYTLTLSFAASSCPNDCSGHGTCNTATGRCSCVPGFSGADCSAGIPDAPLNVWTSQNVERNNFVYYHISVPEQSSSLRIDVNHSASTDVDLYVKVGRIPTVTSFDYVNSGLNPTFNLTIAPPQPGEYYIGFYGFTAADFSFRVTLAGQSSTECPNACSGRGTCNAGVCSCNTGFNSTGCENMVNELTLAANVTGLVQTSQWNHYRYTSRSAQSLIVEMWQESADQDCDLYINEGRNPTLTRFLYREMSLGMHSTLRIDNPGTATFHIGVFGFSQCRYTVSISQTTTGQCPGGCGAHGTCAPTGMCICQAGWTGANCETQASSTNVNQVITTPVAMNEWVYYYVDTPMSALTAIVRDTENLGGVWIFASKNGYPTLSNNDYKDTASSKQIHHITMEFPDRAQRQWYIGLYGGPFLQHNVTAQLYVYVPPF